MKFAPIRHDLMLTVTPLLLLLGALLAWFVPGAMISLVWGYWIFPLILLGLLLSPWRSKRLVFDSDASGSIDSSTVLRRYEPLGWLSRLLGMQVIFYLVYLGVVGATSQTEWLVLLPTSVDSFTLTFRGGLFPWSMVVVLAIGFAGVAYWRGRDGFASELARPLTGQGVHDTLGLVINTLVKRGSLTGLALTFAGVCLFVVADLAQLIRLPFRIGFYPASIVLSFLLLVMILLPWCRRRLGRVWGNPVPLFVSWVVVSFFVVGLIFLVSTVLLPLAGVTATGGVGGGVVAALRGLDSGDLGLLLHVSWWIVWVPMLSVLTAWLSRGYRVDQVILGSLLLPGLVGLYELCVMRGWIVGVSWFHYPGWLLVGVVLGFVGLLWLVLGRERLPMLMLGYLPARDRFKHRDYVAFFYKAFRFGLIMLYLFLPIGLNVLGIFVFAFSWELWVLLPVLGVVVVWGLYKREWGSV